MKRLIPIWGRPPTVKVIRARGQVCLRASASHRLFFIPLWDPCYETCQYPLLLLHGEVGWVPRDILLMRPPG